MGGGSSDSAALLLGLRHFYNRNPYNSKKISLTKLKELGLKIGSDVCMYCRKKYKIKWNWRKNKENICREKL